MQRKYNKIKFPLAFGLLLLLIIIFGCARRSRHSPYALRGKYISVSDFQFDFGYLPQGYLAKHIFRIINFSKKDIHIVDKYTTCGCTEIYLDKSMIPAHDSIYAIVMFNSTGYFDAISKPAVVKTSDSRLKAINFSISANMDFTDNPLLEIQPRALVLEPEQIGSPKTIVLQNITQYSIHVTIADYYYPLLIEPQLDRHTVGIGGAAYLNVETNKNIDSQNFSPGSITITAAIENSPWNSINITIPVTLSIGGANRKFW